MSVFGADLGPPQDRGDWEWVAEQLGDPSTVSGIVPSGFERYARIDHLARPGDSTTMFPFDLLPRVVRFLGALTSTPDRVCFAIWEGYGWNSEHLASSGSDGSARRWRRGRSDPFADAAESLDDARQALEVELAALPSISSPRRNYRVLAGRLQAVLEMHDPIAVAAPRTPELWWPVDRAWFVGSDVDLSSTYVGGSWELVDVLLEGWADRVTAVEPTDLLS